MAKYKTEPLKCWNKAKELRKGIYDNIAKARDEGKMIIAGGTESAISLPAGFDMEFFGGEPYVAGCAFMGKNDSSIYMKYFEAAEAAKYPRDLCAYMRLSVGSLICNSYAFGGTYPKPAFNLQTHICDTQGKWYQTMSELEGVPYNALDFIPFEWESENESEESKNLKHKYLKDQMLDIIDWMEDVGGKKYDDEKFISALNYECESASLWAHCCMLNRNIPAVMDEKMMHSLYVIATLMRHKKASVDFYKELLDELKDRAERGIAAFANERLRLLLDGMPPWHSLEIYRYMEEFGGVSIGSNFSFGVSGGWAYDSKQDTRVPAKPPKEAGVELKTREDACSWYAKWLLETNTVLRSLRFSGNGKNKNILDLVKKWNADGVLIHLNRGCEGTAMGQMEMRYFLAENDIPVMAFEGNHADIREFDLPRIKTTINTFMETLEIKKL
ncbi:MAG: 2-hydroxyacyl-CoA dehydratase family protein [Pseudomonadota bacterium]